MVTGLTQKKWKQVASDKGLKISAWTYSTAIYLTLDQIELIDISEDVEQYGLELPIAISDLGSFHTLSIFSTVWIFYYLDFSQGKNLMIHLSLFVQRVSTLTLPTCTVCQRNVY